MFSVEGIILKKMYYYSVKLHKVTFFQNDLMHKIFISVCMNVQFKFNPGSIQILSKVFLSKNVPPVLTKYCLALITPRYSNDNTNCYKAGNCFPTVHTVIGYFEVT